MIRQRIALFMLFVVMLSCGAACAQMLPCEVWDLGTCDFGNQYAYVFSLSNCLSTPVQVLAVTPSCECVHITQWPTQIGAHAVGEIHALFVPNVLGPVDYRIRVQTSDSERPALEFAICGVVTGHYAEVTGPDWSLYVGAEDAAHLVRTPHQVVWVDVRDPEQFAMGRIPSALNVPHYAVKTKNFLKGRPLVLIDDGTGGSVL